MSVIGNLIFETTGILSKRGLVKRATAIGKEASEIVMKEGCLTQEQANKILANNLGKRAKRITVATNREDAQAAIADAQGIPKEIAGMYYDLGDSLSIAGLNGHNTIMCIKAQELPTDMLSNTLAHESEHALNQTFSARVFLDKLYMKTPWGKKTMEYLKTKSVMLNERVEYAQKALREIENFYFIRGFSENEATKEGLLKQCNCASIKELHQKIQKLLFEKGILTTGNFEDNRLVAKAIKILFKDEARAYNVGGTAERKYMQLLGLETKGKTTLSEMNARFYDEVIKVARKEEWHAKLNKLRVKLGLKPNTKTEEKIMADYKKAELEYAQNIKKSSKYKEEEVSVDEIKQMYKAGVISEEEAKILGVV